MGVADTSGQNLDWEAIRISFQFKIDTSMYMQNFKIKKAIILISFRNFFLQSQFHTYELIVLQKGHMYADIFPHLFPIFFMRHFDCNPLQFDLHLVFYIFKWNSIICISNWKSQIRNLKSLVKWSSNLKSFKLEKISGFNLELTTTISALLPGGLGGDFLDLSPFKKIFIVP